MAHVDRSEVCSTTPLVSISYAFHFSTSTKLLSYRFSRLGCAAVFLIGGLTREVEPIPILLRSGDVVIMSGPRCRRAYHGKLSSVSNTESVEGEYRYPSDT